MSRANKSQSNLILLVVAALCIAFAQADLCEDLTTYGWRWMVYGNAVAASVGCWNYGAWGLFWDNDDGDLIDECMKIYGGAEVTFEDIVYEQN
mmetsp:Transcript_10692/g.17961  ORF Transcript_10692/g.17961 Transcript_10692/m.17961 type:complete len:93 (+) Transcript_10692:52-330(+)|eukprot:CAMPEP_0168616050 /NCGR_PEP_ID=MMETSP0449_2-20121227/4827_1 /TAXON_ID=1082188 /ORGANISM="Strombidium rassoulzadegani, Strain ras09" /LENGTH=92 /DNA_ID=CAMNT_0008656823 /DNA_START=7 /DNA_END=285 /DNA_ORIENTATION=+